MATDQEIRDAGYKYIPQQQYLQNPFEIPTADNAGGGGGGGGGGAGIPYTNAADGFSVYNPDPNSIVNKNYDPYRYRNLMEDSFLYGGSNATDPKYLNQSFDPSGKIANAQKKYDEFQTAPYRMGIDTPVGQRQAKYESDLNEMIMDNQERYRTQGQYETVPSELAYSSQTELDKFKDNYPGYFEPKPLEGIPGAMQKYIQNSLLGKGVGVAKNFLNDLLPTNRRAIMENELGGQGIMVNNIGQIVAANPGNINTAENIMAGYNAYHVDADTFQKRRDMINAKMKDPEQKAAKLKALDEAEAKFFNAKDKADFIYDEEEDKKKKKKKIDMFKFLKKKKAPDTTDIVTDTTDIVTDTATTTDTTSDNDDGPSTFAGDSGNKPGTTGSWTPAGTYTAPSKSPSRPSRHTSGPGGLHSDYAGGGRVYFFDGGRVAVMNGGLISLL